MSRLFYSYLFLAIPMIGLCQEMRIAKVSSSVEPIRLPVAAFFESTMEIDFIVPGNPDVLQGEEVVTRLFQKVGKRFLPLGEPASSGEIEKRDSGFAEVTIKIEIPKLKTTTHMAVRAQVDGTEVLQTLYFTAVPDNLLRGLMEKHSIIRCTNTNSVIEAFRDRNIPVNSSKELEDLRRGDWKGIWFICLEGDDRKNLAIPNSLTKDQVVILFEPASANENFSLFPMAQQRGDGWIIHLDESWKNQFTTNASAQHALVNTINQIQQK